MVVHAQQALNYEQLRCALSSPIARLIDVLSEVRPDVTVEQSVQVIKWPIKLCFTSQTLKTIRIIFGDETST
jgi:hypothetical protein